MPAANNPTAKARPAHAPRIGSSARAISAAPVTWPSPPANVPAAPEKAYVNDGWRGYTHWLCHANHDAAVALPEVPQLTRKLADAPTGSKDVEGSRAGKRRRR